MKEQTTLGIKMLNFMRDKRNARLTARQCRHVVIGCIIMFFICGCSSYRFQGNVQHRVPDAASVSLNNKYRVVSIINNTNVGPYGFQGQTQAFAVADPWSIPAVSKNLPVDNVRNEIMRQYPKVFSNSDDSIPLEIRIRTRSDTKENQWSILFPYLLSLGTLPAFLTTKSQCEMTVTLVNDHKERSQCVLDFQSDNKITAFGPIGLISYDPVPGAVSYRTNSGGMTAPHLDANCLNDLQTVFTETVAAGILKCLQDMERSSLQRPIIPQENKTAPTQKTVLPDVSALAEKIKQLQSLKDAGILTDLEYETKRKALIEQF